MTTLTAVINCYREGELIYKALESLYKQTDKDFVILIVNDCSPDEITNSVCNEIELSKKAKLIRNNVNMGHGLSRNTAFANTNTDAIVFLDADDTLPIDAIERIRRVFDLNPDADFVYGNYLKNYIETEISEIVDCSVLTDQNGKLSPYKLANNWKFLGSSPCKKNAWQRIGGYAQEFSNTTNDIDFWQRVILSGANGYYVNDIIYNYNQSVNGINNSDAFLNALSKCMYKNIDFTIKYSNNYKRGLDIALKNKDYKKIKEWAKFEVKRNKRNFLTGIFFITPSFLLPLLCIVFKMNRRKH